MTAAVSNSVDKADRMARQRATMSTVIGVVLFATMGVHALDFAPWMTFLWMADLALGFAMLLYVSFFLKTDEGRLLDDEVTRSNRLRALSAGFWAGLLAIAIAFVSFEYGGFEPDGLLRVIATVMIGGTLLRFGALERKALADG